MPGRDAPAPGPTRWLFGDQLGPHFLDDHDGDVLLVESRRVFARTSFHRQKAHLVLTAMRHRAAELGERCRYARVDRYRDALAEVDGPLQVIQPTSRAAVTLVRALAEERKVERLPARGFVTTRVDFTTWADSRGRRRLLMEDFYRDARRRHGVLMDGDEPVGGRWNLDAENREPPPKGRPTLGVQARAGPRRTTSTPRSATTWTAGSATATSRSSATTAHAGSPPPVRGAGGARRLRGPPARRFGPLRGRRDDRRPVDGPLPALGPDEPRPARPGRGRPAAEDAYRRGARTVCQPSRVSSGRSWAGATTSGTSTGTWATTTGRQPPQRATAPAGLVRRPRRRRDRRRLPRGSLTRFATRLGPPHPAADGPRQLRRCSAAGAPTR